MTFKIVVFLLFIIYFVYSSHGSDLNSKQKSPVILIPGLGGSKLQAKLNKPSRNHWWCNSQSDYYDIWVNAFQFLPKLVECWVDNMKLTYNYETRTAEDAAGVYFRFPDWRSAEAVDWVAQNYDGFFDDIVNAINDHGYVKGENIFGVPYDFRKGPKENSYMFERLKDLAEYAYDKNNNTSATFIVHSIGGRMLLYFLQQMPQTWKDKYVKQIITLAVPWGGSTLSIKSMAIGHNPIFYMANEYMRMVQETFSSIAWLMPSEDFWSPNETLIIMNERNYTVQDIDTFFHNIGLRHVQAMRNDLVAYNNLSAPGVEVHCLFGSQEDTTNILNFGETFNFEPAISKGDGDGYVNRRSLVGCERWKDTGKHKIHVVELQGIDHVHILDYSAPIDYIVNTLVGKKPELNI